MPNAGSLSTAKSHRCRWAVSPHESGCHLERGRDRVKRSAAASGQSDVGRLTICRLVTGLRFACWRMARQIESRTICSSDPAAAVTCLFIRENAHTGIMSQRETGITRPRLLADFRDSGPSLVFMQRVSCPMPPRCPSRTAANSFLHRNLRLTPLRTGI